MRRFLVAGVVVLLALATGLFSSGEVQADDSGCTGYHWGGQWTSNYDNNYNLYEDGCVYGYSPYEEWTGVSATIRAPYDLPEEFDYEDDHVLPHVSMNFHNDEDEREWIQAGFFTGIVGLPGQGYGSEINRTGSYGLYVEVETWDDPGGFFYEVLETGESSLTMRTGILPARLRRPARPTPILKCWMVAVRYQQLVRSLGRVFPPVSFPTWN
jgi:hypothetical protein